MKYFRNKALTPIYALQLSGRHPFFQGHDIDSSIGLHSGSLSLQWIQSSLYLPIHQPWST